MIILDHLVYFGIIWNLDIFLETFGYFWDILEICWRSIIRVSSVIISYIQQICTILTFQYLTKAAFSGLQTRKMTFSRCVSPLCFPSVSHRFWVEVLEPAFRQTDGNKMKQNETERFSRSFRHFSPVYKIEGVGSEHLEPLGSISRTASVSSNARPQGSAVAAIGLCGLKWGVLGLRPF